MFALHDRNKNNSSSVFCVYLILHIKYLHLMFMHNKSNISVGQNSDDFIKIAVYLNLTSVAC